MLWEIFLRGDPLKLPLFYMLWEIFLRGDPLKLPLFYMLWIYS